MDWDKRPFALDLFCGAGGAALGLQAAGFDVVGVDIDGKVGRLYPGRFIQGDALTPPVDLAAFDFIWASPPCQKFSTFNLAEHQRSAKPDLIPATREILSRSGCRYTAIECVPNAPIRRDIMLTGPTVGLPLIFRRRHFEVSWPCLSPIPQRPKGRIANGTLVQVTRHGGIGNGKCREARAAIGLAKGFTRQEMAEAMGVPADWPRDAIGEAIPPAYAEYVARSALAAGLGS